MTSHRVRSLAPMAYVADVLASAAFYEKLGFEIEGRFTPPGAEAPVWLSLTSERAQLMLALAGEPVVPDQQAVLFYFYCPDVAAMRGQAEAAGLSPGPMNFPFYNPDGEFRLVDPDGYVVMVAHL
jgi:predicted enzyme related to lactoylglutathione lyase